MIYFDVEHDLVLINSRVADLKKLQYVDDPAIVEAVVNRINNANSLINEAHALDAFQALLGGAVDLAKWGVPKVLSYLKEFLPDTLEGWVHLGVDAISLILDILGPFTAGIGTGASAIIDILHGIYYIGASQGDKWTMFPDRSDKEFEYLLCGFITLAFAAVPVGGNAATAAFKTYLKKFPVTKNVVQWLEKLMASTMGKTIEKLFKWIFEKAGSLGKYFYKMFESLSKIPIVGGIFKFFGNKLKDGIAKIASGLDNLLIKMFDKPGMYQLFEKKFGKEWADKYLEKLVAHGAAKGERAATKKAANAAAKDAIPLGKDAAKQAAKGAKEVSKNLLKQVPAYQAIAGKLKMAISQTFADKVNITDALNACWALLAGKLDSKDTELPKLKEVGLPVDDYKDWYLEYAFFLDDEDREDEELSEDDIKEIQQYLIEYAEVYEAKEKPEVTGKIDAATIYSTRQLFEYLKDQDLSEYEGEELEQAQELVEHCTEGLNAINKLDKSLFQTLQEKITPSTNESYLTDFKTFEK